MSKRKIKVGFHSPLADLITGFIQEKRACGCRYERDCQELERLDRFLCDVGLKTQKLPRHIVDQWTAKRAHEKLSNQKLRIIRIRQLAIYLRKKDVDAYIPEATKTPVNHLDFTPYIFNREELRKILAAADALAPDRRTPMRHLIMPEIFRLLYCCGMRISEVLRLTFADVDLAAGILTVRQGKFNIDRLVPLAPSMTARLQKYTTVMDQSEPSEIFFPSPRGGPYSKETVYDIFRSLLRHCGIPHGGRGKGPRLHDIRHAFAVHRLERWYREGADLGAKLPILATYMGHKNLISTQWYLRLTPEIFPDVVKRLEAFTGHVIPRRREK
jgi:integrase/recombinase XerD